MSLARNWNYTTVAIPALTEQQQSELTGLLEKFHRENGGNAMLAAAVSGAVFTALRQTSAASTSSGTAQLSKIAKGDVALVGVDEKTAAMIMGVVCAQLRKQPEQLSFKTIRAL